LKGVPSAAYRAAIADATGLVIQMQALVANLLLLARPDARQIAVGTEAVDLRRLVEDCWRPFEAEAAERRLRFTMQFPADCVVETDSEKLRIVVAILLANAAAYTAPGGAITVRGGSGDTLLEVADSGPPIPDELLPRIFDRFSRGDAPAPAAFIAASASRWCAVSARSLGLHASAHNTPDGGVRVGRARHSRRALAYNPSTA
jgi:two-component system OmpR family sensor kinase